MNRHPELSCLENETAKRIARELRRAGVVVAEGVARTAGLPEALWLEVRVVESTPADRSRAASKA